jgi:hypothetical protein
MIRGRMRVVVSRAMNLVLGQPASQGAWPPPGAATDPGARPGLLRPGGLAEQRGHPRLVGMSAAAATADDAGWLLDRSVELTGIGHDELAPTAQGADR